MAAPAMDHTTAVVMDSLFLVLILVILRLVLGRTWLAVAAFFLLGMGEVARPARGGDEAVVEGSGPL